MRRGVLAIALVSACGGQGVDIEVHQANKSIDAVELWLAYGLCKTADGNDCDGIGWPNAEERPPGTVFTLGDDEKVIRTDVIVDGVAQLHLDLAADHGDPALIAVVGYHGSEVAGVSMLSGVDIPKNDQAHWRIDLDEVGPIAPDASRDPAGGPEHNALVWARKPSSTLPDATGYTGCLAYQKWNDSDKMWVTKYFVPPSDTDCDGDPPDCNPYWYNATTSNARCVDGGGPLKDVCMLGAYSCTSEVGSNTCALDTAPRICMPSKVCSSCKDSDDLPSCLKSEVMSNTTTSMPTVPLERCTMSASDTGPCSNDTQAAGWRASFTVRGASCAPKNATTGAAAIRMPSAPFSGTTNPVTISGGATLSVHAAPEGGTGNCTVEITWVQGLPPFGPLPVVVAVFYGPTTEVLIPVVLDFARPSNMICPPPTNTPQPCNALGPWPVGPSRGDSMFDCTL